MEYLSCETTTLWGLNVRVSRQQGLDFTELNLRHQRAANWILLGQEDGKGWADSGAERKAGNSMEWRGEGEMN